MPNTKTIALDLGELGAGKTVVCKIERDSDGYYLDNNDGSFSASPVDDSLSMTEDATYSGRYSVTENREVWNDGVYNVEFYEIVDTVEVLIQTDKSNCLDDIFYILSVDTKPDTYISERDCDECGFTFKESQLTKRFDGAMVCKWCFEEEHPLDVFRRMRG